MSRVSASELLKAINSFPSGSAGGLDGLRPSIVKDLLMCNDVGLKDQLITSLCDFISIISSGEVPMDVRPIFFGATLIALRKKCGGIRPIAIGNVWRRLTAKIICFRIRDSVNTFLSPHQLGVCVPYGAEAAVHAARIYFSSHHPRPKAVVKLDFRNAFNELNRDAMLKVIQKDFPLIYHYVFQCYSQPSDLFLGDDIILSQRGVQQGDPLGPALFAITLQSIVNSITTELNLWYLDDGTIADDPDLVLSTLLNIRDASSEIGLHLNFSKCEVSFLNVPQDQNDALYSRFMDLAPGIRFMTSDSAYLLGSAISTEALRSLLIEKISKLEFFFSRLSSISAHSAFYLLRASFSIPRLMYFLRCSPSWREESLLQSYDCVLQAGLESILNCSLSGKAWLQATLPVRSGGLGIRRAMDLAIPSFLASFHGSRRLVESILPLGLCLDPDASIQDCSAKWSTLSGSSSPLLDVNSSQSSWDDPIIKRTQSQLLQSATCLEDKARLLAAYSPESGAWLQALPSPPLGLHLSNESFRVAVALRLGADVCVPHRCPACGAFVDQRGLHGLSCIRSAGRHMRHSSVNDVILRALVSANVPSVREPSGCSRSDGKRPDGMTLVPWKRGRPLLWDFTCADTFAISNVTHSSLKAGGAAIRREADKNRKYSNLLAQYIFVAIAIESSGTWGTAGLNFIKEVGRRIQIVSGDARSTTFLIQRLSIAIQRGNVSSILGTLPPGKALDEIFLL